MIVSASVTLGTTDAMSLIKGRGASTGARASKTDKSLFASSVWSCRSSVLLSSWRTSTHFSSCPSLLGTAPASSSDGAGVSPVTSGRAVSLVPSSGGSKSGCSATPKCPMPSLLKPPSLGTVLSGFVEMPKSTSSLSTATADVSADSGGNGASSISPNASDSTCPTPI